MPTLLFVAAFIGSAITTALYILAAFHAINAYTAYRRRVRLARAVGMPNPRHFARLPPYLATQQLRDHLRGQRDFAAALNLVHESDIPAILRTHIN